MSTIEDFQSATLAADPYEDLTVAEAWASSPLGDPSIEDGSLAPPASAEDWPPTTVTARPRSRARNAVVAGAVVAALGAAAGLGLILLGGNDAKEPRPAVVVPNASVGSVAPQAPSAAPQPPVGPPTAPDAGQAAPVVTGPVGGGDAPVVSAPAPAQVPVAAAPPAAPADPPAADPGTPPPGTSVNVDVPVVIPVPIPVPVPSAPQPGGGSPQPGGGQQQGGGQQGGGHQGGHGPVQCLACHLPVQQPPVHPQPVHPLPIQHP